MLRTKYFTREWKKKLFRHKNIAQGMKFLFCNGLEDVEELLDSFDFYNFLTV